MSIRKNQRARKPRVRTDKAMQLGAWLRYVRKEVLKLSQGQLARQLKVARGTVSSWESGHFEPAKGKLIEFGNLAPFPYSLTAWREGGVNVEKLQVESRMEPVRSGTAPPVALGTLPIPVESIEERLMDLAEELKQIAGEISLRKQAEPLPRAGQVKVPAPEEEQPAPGQEP